MSHAIALAHLLLKGMVAQVVVYDSAVDGPPALLIKCPGQGRLLFVITTKEFGVLCGVLSQFRTTGGFATDPEAELFDDQRVHPPTPGEDNVFDHPSIGTVWAGGGVCLFMGDPADGFRGARTNPNPSYPTWTLKGMMTITHVIAYAIVAAPATPGPGPAPLLLVCASCVAKDTEIVAITKNLAAAAAAIATKDTEVFLLRAEITKNLAAAAASIAAKDAAIATLQADVATLRVAAAGGVSVLSGPATFDRNALPLTWSRSRVAEGVPSTSVFPSRLSWCPSSPPGGSAGGPSLVS